MANKVMCNAVELKGAIYALFVSENILVLHVFLLWGQSEFLSIEICMLLPPLTQGTDTATGICLNLIPSPTMSPLYFNLLFILVFSTTCLAIQERAIGMSNYNFQRHGSYISPNVLESCGLFYEQYSEKLKMEVAPDIMEDFKLAAKEGRIGGKSTLIQ